MNAIQPSRKELQPAIKPRVVSRPHRKLRQRSYQIMAVETTTKIVVNLAICAVASSALVQLLPNHWSQQEKLRDIRTEVKLMEGRVDSLKSEFSRNFDPRQAKSIMQQQGNRVDPNQKSIVLNKDGNEATVQRPDSSP